MDKKALLQKVIKKLAQSDEIYKQLESVLPKLQQLPPEKLKTTLDTYISRFNLDSKKVYNYVEKRFEETKKDMVKRLDILEQMSRRF